MYHLPRYRTMKIYFRRAGELLEMSLYTSNVLSVKIDDYIQVDSFCKYICA